MEEHKKIRRNRLVEFADQARRLSGGTEKIPLSEILEQLQKVEEVISAEETAFGATQIEPDINYKIGYNWFAGLVALAQKMAGTAQNLTPAQILEELNRVVFIPQGRASSEILNSNFTFSTEIKNPEYQTVRASDLVEILGALYTKARLPVDAPVTASCYEATGTSLAGTITVVAGDWILATVSARSAMTYPDGWTLLHETQPLSADNSNQRMAFLCRQADADETITMTMMQEESARLYMNLIAVSNIGGFAYHGGEEYVNNNVSNGHSVEKPADKTVIWGCTANFWDTATVHAQWSCDEISANAISLGTDTQARQANFYDNDGGTTRNFVAGTADTAAIIDYVEVLSA